MLPFPWASTADGALRGKRQVILIICNADLPTERSLHGLRAKLSGVPEAGTAAEKDVWCSTLDEQACLHIAQTAAEQQNSTNITHSDAYGL